VKTREREREKKQYEEGKERKGCGRWQAEDKRVKKRKKRREEEEEEDEVRDGKEEEEEEESARQHSTWGRGDWQL
jgi:hypothetical protein